MIILNRCFYLTWWNVFFIKEYSDNDFYGKTIAEFAQKRYDYINSFYRKLKTIVNEETHKKYGKYFLIQYSDRVRILKNSNLSSTEATVVEAIIVHNKKKYILTYYFENSYFNQYFNDAIQIINSFKIKE